MLMDFVVVDEMPQCEMAIIWKFEKHKVCQNLCLSINDKAMFMKCLTLDLVFLEKLRQTMTMTMRTDDRHSNNNNKNLVLPYGHPQSPVAVICYVISLCLAYVVVPAAAARRRHRSPARQRAQQSALTAAKMPSSSVDASWPPPGDMLPQRQLCPPICKDTKARTHINHK